MVARGGKEGIAVSGERERFPITKMRGGSGFFFQSPIGERRIWDVPGWCGRNPRPPCRR